MDETAERKRYKTPIIDTGVVHERLYSLIKDVGSVRKLISELDEKLSLIEGNLLITDMDLENSMLNAEMWREATSSSGF